jgi:predicted nucleotidyltransferase
MFFQPIPSQTHSQPFEDVLNNLRRHEIVEALLTLGSTATGDQTSSSDYDVLIVLREMPFPLQVLLTTINGRLSDILFAPTSLLTRIRNREPQETFTPYETIIRQHLGTGKIIYDKNKTLPQIRSFINDNPWHTVFIDEQIYRVIHGINFNYQHNKRYYKNPDLLYQMVLDIRLNYSIDQLLSSYFLIRKLAWQGEKKAIRYWQENDPAFLTNFQKYFNTASRDEKFLHYTRLARQVLSPVGDLWPDDSVNIVLDGDWAMEDIPQSINYWHTLIAA